MRIAAIQGLTSFWRPLGYLLPLLFVAADQPPEWLKREVPAPLIAAIGGGTSQEVVGAATGLSRNQLNLALLAACGIGQLDSSKVLIGLGATPSFVIERHPASGKVSPLFYAVKSDNQSLIAYLLTFKRAVHFEKDGNCLELAAAAYWGRSQAAVLILTTVREEKPRGFRRYLGDAAVGMIWNKQKTAAIELLSKYRPELSESVIATFRKDVLLVDGPTSGQMLDEVWEAVKEAR